MPASKLTTIDMSQAEMLVSAGHTDMCIADFFNMDVRTWRYWLSNHPEFSLAYDEWKIVAIRQVERALFQRAIGMEQIETTYEKTGDWVAMRYGETEDIRFEEEYRKTVKVKHLAPDTAACIMVLKNMMPEEWKDRVEMKHSATDLGAALMEARGRAAGQRAIDAPLETACIEGSPLFE